jgi:hypothetical protein
MSPQVCNGAAIKSAMEATTRSTMALFAKSMVAMRLRVVNPQFNERRDEVGNGAATTTRGRRWCRQPMEAFEAKKLTMVVDGSTVAMELQLQ